MTETKQDSKLKVGDSHAVKEDTVMTQELKDIIDEIHGHKITPPNANAKYPYWSTYLYLPKVKGKTFRKKVTEKTEEEVYLRLAKHYGVHIVNPDATVKDMFYDWYNTRLEDDIEEQTFDRTEATFKKYFVNTGWSNRKIKDISENQWIYFIENTVRDKIHPIRNEKITVKEYGRLKDVTKAIISQAKRDNLISYEWGTSKGDTKTGVLGLINLGKGAFKKKQKRDDVYKPDEMKKILDYCEKQDDPKADVIRLMSMSGMRVGEAVCITHADINPTELIISVNKTEVKTNKGVKVANHTKTDAGTRTVKIKDDHRQFITELYFKSSSQSYVFINRKKNKSGKNGRIGEQAIRRYLKDVCEKVGVTYKGTHAIRKYYSSIMKLYGVPDEIRKKQLGHTDISTTEKHYDKDLYTKQEKADYLNACVGI